MNNPERILHALDAHLRRPTRVVVFGRAALVLGYADAPAGFGATQDMEAILPEIEMASIESDTQFWDALEAANRELEPTGLYMTHLFADSQVILTPDWLSRICPLASTPRWGHLALFRPATPDLILTKMMRDDPQDLADIAFLLTRDPQGPEQLRRLFSEARVPAVPEIASAFAAMQPRVLALGATSDT